MTKQKSEIPKIQKKDTSTSNQESNNFKDFQRSKMPPQMVAQQKLQSYIDNSPLPKRAAQFQQMADQMVGQQLQRKGDINDNKEVEKRTDGVGQLVAKGRDEKNTHQKTPLSTVAKTAQLKAKVIVIGSGRYHYDDGWGAMAGIESDEDLIDAIGPVDKVGYKEIYLGYYVAPDSEQAPDDRRFAKAFKIAYRAAREPNTVAVFHCGPSGRKEYFNERDRDNYWP